MIAWLWKLHVYRDALGRVNDKLGAMHPDNPEYHKHVWAEDRLEWELWVLLAGTKQPIRFTPITRWIWNKIAHDW